MPIISAVGKRSPQSTTTIRPSYSTTVMFLPISPTPPSGRTRRVPLTRLAARCSSPWRSSIARTSRASRASSALDHRQAHGRRLVAQQVQRRLDAGRAGGDEQRRVDVAQRGVDLRARARARRTCGASPSPTTCEATQMPPAPPMSRQRAQDVVVAGQHGQAVDRLQLVGVGLLDRLDAVDLRQLGEQVGRHVDRRAAGDVVEDHRRAGGGARDLLEVAHDARAGSACCSTA